MEMNGTIEKYLNKELCVKPFYGYGWSSYPQRRTYEDNVPVEFEIKLLELCKVNGEIIGGLGVITTPNHEFFHQYLSFTPRYEGSHSNRKP